MKEEKGNKNLNKVLISKIIKEGNKVRSEKVILDVYREIKKREKKSPIEIIKESVENISPKVSILSKKVGGTRYQIPVPIKENKEVGIGCRWLVSAVKNNKMGTINEKIIKELYLAKNKDGEVVKKKNALHQVAIKNIAFLKFLG